MKFLLNAMPVDLPAEDPRPVLDIVRDAFGLTAAKPACGSGDCGACLVLLGETPPDTDQAVYRAVNSCLLTASRVEGCHVITAEGLNRDGANPLHRILAETGAVQCGYCTPGLAMAMTGALLNGDDLNEAASGNLCRCTGYAGIRRALEVLEARFGRERRSLDTLATLGLLAPDVATAARHLPSPPPSPPLFPLPPAGIRAGNTDRGVQHPHLPAGQDLLELHRIPGLRRIDGDQDELRVGAAVTVAELQRHPLIRADWPALPAFLNRFASPSIREMATVGGNLVNASPVADLDVLLLALSAGLTLSSPRGERRIPLENFHAEYHRTVLLPGEVLTLIHVPRNHDHRLRLHFDKVAQRERDDIAIVNTALSVDEGLPGCFGTVRISAGGVGPCPVLLRGVMDGLSGHAVSPVVVRSALRRIDESISPISDHRGSAAYKRRLLLHLVAGHLIALFPELPFEECLP